MNLDRNITKYVEIQEEVLGEFLQMQIVLYGNDTESQPVTIYWFDQTSSSRASYLDHVSRNHFRIYGRSTIQELRNTTSSKDVMWLRRLALMVNPVFDALRWDIKQTEVDFLCGGKAICL
ncbi:hypothetical protein SCUP234_06532 [Seiridium cupressi]